MPERVFRKPEQNELFAQHLRQFRATPNGHGLVNIFQTIPGVQMSSGGRELLVSEELMGNPERDLLGGRLAEDGASFVWGGVSPVSREITVMGGLSIISFVRIREEKFNSGVRLGFNTQGELIFGTVKGFKKMESHNPQAITVDFKATGEIAAVSGKEVRSGGFISIQRLLTLITQPDFTGQPQDIVSLLQTAQEA